MQGNAGNPPIHEYHSLINSSEHLLRMVQALYERLKMQESMRQIWLLPQSAYILTENKPANCNTICQVHEKGRTGGYGRGQEDSDRVSRGQEDLPGGNRSHLSCVFVRQEVDRRIKLPCTVHSLLSRDPDAETYLHNPGPSPGRTMSLVLCLAETQQVLSVRALCICVGHTHTQNERVHAKVNYVPQGDCDPGVFLGLQTAA